MEWTSGVVCVCSTRTLTAVERLSAVNVVLQMSVVGVVGVGLYLPCHF
jgi:hypothetical protein